MTRWGAIVRATVCGNDYFRGLQGVGPVTLEALMDRFKDDELGLFRHLYANYPAFLPLYQRVEAIYYDAPGFEVRKGQFNTETGMRRLVFMGRIVSHRGNVLSPKSWQDTVGFDPDELLFAEYKGDPQEGPD